MDTQSIELLLAAIKRQVARDAEKCVNRPNATIRHREANETGVITAMLTSCPTYAHNLDEEDE